MTDELNQEVEQELEAIEAENKNEADSGVEYNTTPESAEVNTESQETPVKTFTQDQVQKMISGRFAQEKAKIQRLEKQLSQYTAADDTEDQPESYSKEQTEDMVNSAVEKKLATQRFVDAAKPLDEALGKARNEDRDFDELCKNIPNETAMKFYQVFAGQKDCVPVIKNILQDSDLKQRFESLNNPVELAGVIAKAQSNTQPSKSSYSGGPPLKGELTRSGHNTMQAEQSFDELEAELVR